MGFLHKLWDETLAGPAPESGLGKLRKFNSLPAASRQPSSSHHRHRHRDGDDHFPVSRSITILRTNSSTNSNSAASDLPNLNVSTKSGSVPSSPSSSTTPVSPFSPTTPRGDFKKLTRRKSTSEALQPREPRSPTGYDWIVLSALDR